MVTKKSASKAISSKPEKSKQTGQTKLINSAAVMSAATSEAFSKSMFPDMDLAELVDDLKAKVENVQAGDLTSMEAMLVAQAHSLQTIFVSLARRAVNQEYLKNYGIFMNLALKAQSQSRATIQALTELKYPKQVAFVKQANISNGHQQINNGVTQDQAVERGSCAGKTIKHPNELLEANYGSQKMDSRTAQTTIPKDQAMETVGK